MCRQVCTRQCMVARTPLPRPQARLPSPRATITSQLSAALAATICSRFGSAGLHSIFGPFGFVGAQGRTLLRRPRPCSLPHMLAMNQDLRRTRLCRSRPRRQRRQRLFRRSRHSLPARRQQRSKAYQQRASPRRIMWTRPRRRDRTHS
jgi:hypothetical protein